MVAFKIPNYGSSVSFDYTPVDSFGAFSLAIDVPGWAQTIGSHTIWQGDLDLEAYVECVQTAARSRPTFTSVLATIGPPWRQQLVWRHTSRHVPVDIKDLSGVPPPGPDEDLGDWLNRHTGLASWEPDLTVESPLRYAIGKLPDDRWFISRCSHHALGDLGTYAAFNFDIDLAYDRFVNGDSSRYTETFTDYKTSLKAVDVSTVSFLEYMRIIREEDRNYPRSDVAQPMGTPGANRRITAGHLFDPDFTQRMRSHAREEGGTMTDLVIASATLAVNQWNTARGRPPLVQRYNVAVSQRGRADEVMELHGGTQTSLVTIASRAEEWGDPQVLLKLVAGRRIERMEQGCDMILDRLGRRVSRILSVVPVNSRLKLIRRVSRPDSTMLLSNVGTAGVNADDPSASRVTGGMVFDFSLPIGFAVIDTPVIMGMSLRKGGAQLRLLSNEEHMTKGELTELTELVAEKMAAYVD